MIKIENLTKRYGQIKALDNVSFEIDKGEILGFLGPNGAGKTTTMNILTGYIPATSGTVTVDGFDVMDNPYEVKKRIGYLPEQPPLYFDMTVKEYLFFVSDLKKVDKDKQKAHIADIVHKLKIENVYDRVIKNLSKGYKQRVGFAQALIGNPPVLVLDEPTVGLDPTQVIEIRKLINFLKKDHTIILSSHILSEVSAIANRIVIINNGKIAYIHSKDGSSGADEERKISATVVAPKSEAIETIQSINGVKSVSRGEFVEEGTYRYVIDSEKGVDVRKDLFFTMSNKGYPIVELRALDDNLEDIFIDVIKGEEREVHK